MLLRFFLAVLADTCCFTPDGSPLPPGFVFFELVAVPLESSGRNPVAADRGVDTVSVAEDFNFVCVVAVEEGLAGVNMRESDFCLRAASCSGNIGTGREKIGFRGLVERGGIVRLDLGTGGSVSSSSTTSVSADNLRFFRADFELEEDKDVSESVFDLLVAKTLLTICRENGLTSTALGLWDVSNVLVNPASFAVSFLRSRSPKTAFTDCRAALLSTRACEDSGLSSDSLRDRVVSLEEMCSVLCLWMSSRTPHGGGWRNSRSPSSGRFGSGGLWFEDDAGRAEVVRLRWFRRLKTSPDIVDAVSRDLAGAGAA